jgi:hypothetical protein
MASFVIHGCKMEHSLQTLSYLSVLFLKKWCIMAKKGRAALMGRNRVDCWNQCAAVQCSDSKLYRVLWNTSDPRKGSSTDSLRKAARR